MKTKMSDAFLIVERKLNSLIGCNLKGDVKAFKYLNRVSSLSNKESWGIVRSWSGALPNWVNETIINAKVLEDIKDINNSKSAQQIVTITEDKREQTKRFVLDNQHGKFVNQSVKVETKKIDKKVRDVKFSKNINRYESGHTEEDAIGVLVEQERQMIKNFWNL